MTVMDDWVTAVCTELDLDPAGVPVPAVLDLARDVAHQVLRPGAPVTAYLLGWRLVEGRTRPMPRPGSARWRAPGPSSWAPTLRTRRRPDRRCPIPVRADSAHGRRG